MKTQNICILGGAGFVGHALANRLSQQGKNLIIPTRNRQAHRHNLIMLPGVRLVQANVFDPKQLQKLFAGCDVVINLIGILNEKVHGGSGFKKVHVDLLRIVLDVARSSGIKRFIQMSALNANSSRGPSYYLRSRGEAEELLHGAWDMQSTIFRPSVIFGPGDSFFNRFASLLRFLPVLPLACPSARLAPVYVGDVAKAIGKVLDRPDSFGRTYNLCGPRSDTLLSWVRYTAHRAGLHRSIMPLSPKLSKTQALVCEYLPGKPFSIDNYYSLSIDSVCSEPGGDLPELGIEPTPAEEIVPDYLGKESSRQELYDRLRKSTSQWEA